MIDGKLNDYMFKFIEDVCNDIGPRESGTEQELLAGNMIEEEMKKFCDETHQEEYISSPHAFLGFISFSALFAIISVVLFWISLSIDLGWISVDRIVSLILLIIIAILMTWAVSYLILEVVRYYEAFDFMFAKKTSKNVVGTIEPSGEVKHTLIFSGHHDSQFQFNLFFYLKRVGQYLITIGLLLIIIAYIFSILKLVFFFVPINSNAFFFGFGIFFLCLVPVAALFLFFITYKPVQGAFDNLSGVAIVLGIGKYLSENKNESKIFPKHTRIRLVSFAGEEMGLRGSKRYVAAHYNELKESGAINVNIDGIAEIEKVLVIKKEPFIGAKYRPEFYEPVLKIARDLGIDMGLGPLSFGATDGASFDRKGLPAVTISGLDLSKELVPYYHTKLDTPEVVDKKALGQVLQICLKYMEYIDASA